MKVIRLIIYNTSLEANSIIGRVENEDVHSLIFNEKFYTLMPHYIQIFETGVHEMILEEEMGMATEYIQWIKRWKYLCPACGSVSIEISHGKTKII